ncbi:ABC transporter permease (plasmid) [Bosea sp. F3-2]|uniref:ABC transporter permease n=1 Tax=Bosea sp. F3-2 TaxID=2599640 RepID=UPI0011EF8D1A|nr:ABC transporter permease [Bosea sp. F3-2]QEL27352.1 ABC transporter permease [Bosea sp. F3-2]
MTLISTEPFAAAAPGRKTALRIFLGNRRAVVGSLAIAALTIACIFGPALLPYGDTQIDMRGRFTAPLTGSHILGTDQLGRDVLARLLMAGRVSLGVGVLSMLFSIVIGSTIGLIAGYYRGVVGAVLMRIVDSFLCFPSIFLLLAVSAFLKPGVTTIVLLIACTTWMEIARIVEAQVRAVRDLDYVYAARAMGASNGRIIFRSVLPNVFSPIIVASSLKVAGAILSESYISFLGFGIQPPTPSWGNMLNNAQTYLTSYAWLALLPGSMITIAVIGFNFIGDGLRDALDPKQETSTQL